MKKAIKIVVTQFEGRSRDCDVPHTFLVGTDNKVWERASAKLRAIGNSEPPDMLGCLKCGFHITFEDGHEYEGRFEAKRGSETLAKHVRTHCEFYSGRAQHPYMGETRYRKFLDAVVKPEARAEYAKILDEYEIGDSYAPAPSAQESFLERMGA